MKQLKLLSIIGLLAVQTMYAQFPSIYECDFEDEAQNAGWFLHNGIMAESMPHTWVIDTAANNGGKKGLYISADGGKTAQYKQAAGYVIAYTDVFLREGEYDLSFDWRAMGYMDSIYVAWVPDRNGWGDSIQLLSNQTTTIAGDLKSYLLTVAEDKYGLNNAATWKTSVIRVKSNGKHRRLAFIWLTSGATTIANPGACIDNVLIIDSKACPPPQDLTVAREGNKVRLSWVGDATGYIARLYSYMEDKWYEQIVSDTTALFSGMSEGLCDFYVRSVCDDDVVSIKSTLTEYLLYFPQNHCIDYITMDSVNCYIANEKVSTNMPVSKLTWKNAKVDDGYASKSSRHTLHISQSETDPRTGGMLKTVPESEIASVRLGNWDVGAEAERVEYFFRVDKKTSPVLVLKYAVVLQHPNDQCKPNPGFSLRVLTPKGQLVSKCASADFDYKKAAEAEWEMFQPESGGDIRWKDWTTVGVDLSEYDGSVLIVQLTTNDCGAGGHYGYAYFTLGCASAQLEGLTCGEVNTEFTAPNGFKYVWYKESDPTTIVGHERVLKVLPEDTCRYAVDMMFEQDSSCYFTLYACAKPYQPSADFEYSHQPSECTNYMYFTNRSHVKETNQVTGEIDHTSTVVEDILWDFGDGTTSRELNPVHVYPNEGGQYNLKLIAYLSTCTDTLYQTINVPAIGTKRDTLTVQQCYGSSYTFNGNDYTESGLYTDTITAGAWTGCDSLVTLNLIMVDTIFTYIDTLIMKGDTLHVGNETFDKSGHYRVDLVAQVGCDSVVIVDLVVYEQLRVQMDTLFTVCHGEYWVDLDYNITQGATDLYSLKMSDEHFQMVEHGNLTTDVIRLEIPAQCEPNRYKGFVTFEDSISGNIVLPFVLVINYSTQVFAQRWNDVLAVKNSEYNGGYTFTSYQWYKNGKPIEGATQSILYVPEGLDVSAYYTASLTRNSDNLTLPTCPIQPEKIAGMNDIPNLVPLNAPIQIKGKGTAYWFTALGLRVSEQAYEDSPIVAPGVRGSYIVQLLDNQTNTPTSYHVIVW